MENSIECDEIFFETGDVDKVPFLKRISDFENVRDKIVLKVVNFRKEEKELEDCPYHRVLDLAVTLRIFFNISEGRAATVLVNNDLIDIWGVDADSLFELASQNISRLWEPLMMPLGDMIRILAGVQEDLQNEEDDEFGVPLYFLSNNIKINGVIMLFCTDCVSRLADHFGSDIYILPSSIHELILLPVTDDLDGEYLKSIVESVNREVVEEKDFLSDHVYRYLKDDGRFIIEA